MIKWSYQNNRKSLNILCYQWKLCLIKETTLSLLRMKILI